MSNNLDSTNGIKSFLMQRGFSCIEKGELDGLILSIYNESFSPNQINIAKTSYVKFWKKFINTNTYIFFHDRKTNYTYLYNHDELLYEIHKKTGTILDTPSWHKLEYYNITYIRKVTRDILEKYRI